MPRQKNHCELRKHKGTGYIPRDSIEYSLYCTLKNVLYWPEDDCLTVKTCCHNMTGVYVYNITVLIYSCVLTECNTLYKFVTTQWDGFCQM